MKRSSNVNQGSFFRDQLAVLLEQISLTVPHFVRCIKASDRVVQKVALSTGGSGRLTEGSGSVNPLLKKGKRPSTAAAGASGRRQQPYSTFYYYKMLAKIVPLTLSVQVPLRPLSLTRPSTPCG